MTNDNFIAAIEDYGYSYNPEDRTWRHKDGRELIDRELSAGTVVDGTLLLRDEAKIPGFVKAIQSSKMENWQGDFDDAFRVAKEDFDEIDTLRELRDFTPDELLKKAEASLPAGKKKYFDLIRDDIEKLEQAVDIEKITNIAQQLREARSEADLQRIAQEAKRDIKGTTFEKVVAITGLEGPDIVVAKKKPTSSFVKAQERIARNKSLQEEARALTREQIEQGRPSTIKSFADFWGFDTKDEGQLEMVRNLIVGKGFKIDKKPSGQERFTRAKGVFEE